MSNKKFQRPPITLKEVLRCRWCWGKMKKMESHFKCEDCGTITQAITRNTYDPGAIVSIEPEYNPHDLLFRRFV